MNLHRQLWAGAVLLALAACQPGAAEYTAAESPKRLALDNASAQIDLRFAPGSSRLLAGDAARLRAMAASGSLAPSDRVTVATSGGPALAAARFDAIAAELLRYRIVASARQLAKLPPNHAVIASERYLVSLPACPDWSKPSAGAGDFTNSPASNHGCATSVNLGLIVASPADLVEGRPVALADGQPAAAAVNRYLNDQVILPAAAMLGPIEAAPPAPAPAAPAAGAGAAR
jgi:pilus biogenesis lipoprotein CpaD